MVMVFNATFNNISVISWQSVFIGGENQRTKRKPDPSQVTGKLDHIKLYQYTSPWVGFKLTLTVIGTNGIYGSCKSNYSQTLNVLKFVLVSFHINDMSIWFLIAHYRIPFISRTTCEKCLDLFIFSFTNLHISCPLTKDMFTAFEISEGPLASSHLISWRASRFSCIATHWAI